MARRPKNPINDIVDTVGAWLGGSKGSVTNPQVQAAMDATRAIGKVVDTATGGFGQAVVSDAQRMAASGSSTPSALYKTAAVNLAAAAAGAGAAKVAQKTVAKVAPQLMQDVGLHMSDVKGIKSVVYDEAQIGAGFGPSFRRPVLQNVTYKFSQYGPELGSKTGVGEMLTPEQQAKFWGASQRRMAYVTRSPIGRVDPENPAVSGALDAKEWFDRGGKLQSQRITGPQRVVAAIERKGTNFYNRELTLIEAIRRERAVLEAQRAAVAGRAAVVAGLAPKKNARGGGKNKK